LNELTDGEKQIFRGMAFNYAGSSQLIIKHKIENTKQAQKKL